MDALITMVITLSLIHISPQSMLVVSMVVYLSLLVARYAVQKRRGTLPEHMLVADHDGGSEQTR